MGAATGSSADSSSKGIGCVVVESGDEWHGFHMTAGLSTRIVGDSQGLVGFKFRGAAITGGVDEDETNG